MSEGDAIHERIASRSARITCRCAGRQGVYVGHPNGFLEKVVDTGDTLGGATPYIFDLSREALSDGRLAFKAIAGPETALWITPAPEPGAFAAGCVALLAFAGVRRARQ